jgi:hypothetical protein
MKREFNYEESGSYKKEEEDDYAGYDNKKDDTYDSYPKSSRDTGKSSYEGYNTKSSYEGQGKTSYEGYGSTTYDAYNSTNRPSSKTTYDSGNKKREESPTQQVYSKSKGWDDVRRAQKSVQAFKTSGNKPQQQQEWEAEPSAKEDESGGFGFDHGFDKFDYGKGNKSSVGNKKSNNDDAV